MSDSEPDFDEGVSPGDDVKKQNPTGTTTGEAGGDPRMLPLAE